MSDDGDVRGWYSPPAVGQDGAGGEPRRSGVGRRRPQQTLADRLRPYAESSPATSALGAAGLALPEPPQAALHQAAAEIRLPESDTADEPRSVIDHVVPPLTAAPPRARPPAPGRWPQDTAEPSAYPGARVADPGTAAAFTEETMLRPRETAPEKGWQRVVHKATGGRVHPGPSAAELRKRELVAQVKTPVHGCRKIAVISRKGGVGKTTSTLYLGHTFAAWRGDRVVALDGNPDAGSLGYRVRRETTATVTDLLDDAGRIERYADIRGYTSQASTRLEVIASDDDPHISQAIGEQEYRQAIGLLERHYNLILLDTGTGILDSATQGILRMADQLVVVTAPSLDGARAASLTLDWLEQHGYGRLVNGAVAVLNGARDKGLVEIDRVEAHFATRCRAAVRVPWDPHLDAGALTNLEDLRPATQAAYLELAAAVAAGFTR